MTKTAKVESVKTEAESTVKSLFKVVDARAKAEGYVASARETVKNVADKAVSGAAGIRAGADFVMTPENTGLIGANRPAGRIGEGAASGAGRNQIEIVPSHRAVPELMQALHHRPRLG